MALSNALKTDVNNLLQSAPKAQAAPKLSGTEQAMQDVTSAGEQYYKSQADTETAKQQVDMQAMQAKAQAMQESATRERGLQETADRDTWAEPAFNPTKNQPMEIGKIFSLIATMGVMSGGGGKMGAMQAMNAMTGMLKGYQAGDQEAYERAKVEYDEGIKTIQSHNAQILKHLETSLKLEATDREAALVEREMAARLAGSSSITAKLLEQGKAQAAYENAKSVLSQQEKLDTLKEQANIAASQSETTFQHQKQLEQMRIDAANAKKVGTAGPIAHIYDATGKTMPDTKTAISVNQASVALRNITDLRDRLKDPDIETGLRMMPSALKQKISSLVGKNVSEEDINSTFAESGLSPNDKTVLFLKDATLLGLQIEQALTGSRVPVFTQKVVGPILDPKGYTSKTYDALLATREKQLYQVGEDNNFTRDEMSKIAGIGMQSSEAKAMPSGDKLDAYAKTHFNGNVDAAKDYLRTQGYQ